MNYKPILIVHGEPNSIFLEIFFKSIKYKKFKCPIILICSLKVLQYQMKKLNYKKKIKLVDYDDLKNKKLNNKFINIIDVKYNYSPKFRKISSNSNIYINNCFKMALKILNSKITYKLINGPVSKKYFLNKKLPGITEYLAKKTDSSNVAMIIYNKKLSVCPVTTHLPIKIVSKKINKEVILKKVNLINKFYLKYRGFKPKIAVLGLNPHCESIHKFNEDEKIISPTINILKKKYKISGPFSADTIFLKKNREKFDIIIGMYHDQVLTPLKTIYEYDAINITLGLPFIRISPDHGPNEKMLGKNVSDPLSLIQSLNFLEKN